jgi:tetratricopeptide (TPR) repeat protein
MALGFGFNKTKVLAAAEKYVQQGKLQNAISEYQKVIKEDPKDLTVINTVGDMYARLGQSDQAAACFKKVGDAYANDGFIVKAIAMYKKLTKLAAGNTEAILRLAELYTQQGLYNDARQQYVLVADQQMKNGSHEAAAGIFKKILELDPENANAQTKLADLYTRLGKKDDARAIFLNAAQSLYAKGAVDAAAEAIHKVLKLAPSPTWSA